MIACKHCGGAVESRDELTLQGFHPECGAARQRDEITQLIEHRGPHFDHWRKRCLAAFGVAALDDRSPAT